jgi:hypothetical protein
MNLERIRQLPVGDDARPHQQLAEPLSSFSHM